ncbi:DNA sulfur modification protein DndD [Priestia sp. TGN 0903]|uniref:DNA sulfur modification protein DndD n=1 Tax=Priestia sp. TGN 0903 TaxID=3420730 RepID=UPI003D789E0B
MYYTEIEFQNFGSFYGDVKIPLAVDFESGRNIILIGGENGAGKSTFLDGINLVLFGKYAPSLKNRNQYHEIIGKRLNNRAFFEGKRKSSVKVSFLLFKRKGGHDTLTVKREWHFQQRRVMDENITVTINGFEQEQYKDSIEFQNFINRLIPVDVSKFFIFDGEKVRRLAEASNMNEAMGEAIGDVLNINIHKKLHDTLETIKEQMAKETSSKSMADLLELSGKQHRSKAALQRFEKDRKKLLAENESLLKEIKSATRWVSEYGLPSTKERPLLEKELEECRARLEENELEALENTTEHLPFMILMPILQKIEKRLGEEEERAKSEKVREDKLEQANKALKILDDSSIIPPLLPEQKSCLSSLLMDILCDKKVSEKIISLHYEVLSHVDRQYLTEEIGEEIEKARQNNPLLAHLKKSYIENQIRIEEIKRILKGLPTGTQLTQQEKALENLLEKHGSLQQKLEEINGLVQECKDEIKTLQEEENQLKKEVSGNERLTVQIEKIEKIQNIVSSYLTMLKRAKANEVLDFFRESFCEMINKANGYYRNFSIHEDTFEITFEDPYGEIIHKDMLSSGQKQIYAMCVLSALTRASDREFGVVIDTVEGRLDQTHRRHLHSIYLPYSSKQTILLSTDSEITSQQKAMLNPKIARSYLLIDNPTHDQVDVIEGYFM